MAVRPVPETGPLVLGILYPTVWFGDAAALAEEIAAIEALDPRLEVRAVTYDEPHDLRTLRGRAGGAEVSRDLAPALTDEQREMFTAVHAVVGLDLPFDVGTIAPNLTWVQGVGAGSAQLQSAGLVDVGIRLTTSAGSNAVAIAEFVVGRVLHEHDGKRSIVSHHNKATKGRIVRSLAQAASQPGSIEDLVDALAGLGYAVELHPARKPGIPAIVDIIVSEV